PAGIAGRDVLTPSVVGRVRTASMLDAMNFQNRRLVVEDAREAILSDTQLLEWTTRKRFEIVVRITPLRGDHLIEFRDDPILHVAVETIELVSRPRCELPRPLAVLTRHPRPDPSSHAPRLGTPAPLHRIVGRVRWPRSASTPHERTRDVSPHHERHTARTRCGN